MERLTKFFMQRRLLFWSLIIILALLGVVSFLQMPKLEDPAIYGRQATVVVPYPGATAHEVELAVAQMVEEQLNTLPNIKEIRTTCSEDAAVFTVEFNDEMEPSDMEQQFDLLRRKVRDFSSSLPQGSYDPIVVDDMMDVYGIMYALTGDGHSYEEMLRYAKLIRNRLLEVDGVKRVNIAGVRSQSINITVDKDRLAANGMLPTQLMLTLQGIGKPLSAGRMDAGERLYTLRVSGEESSVEEIADLLLTTPQGKAVRLGDVVQSVSLDYDEPQTGGFFVDGQPALAICVALETDAVVPDVGRAVDNHLQRVMQNVPAGLDMTKIYFQPDKVRGAIGGFAMNVVESVLIVILILILFVGWRSGLIVGFGLILTILMSFPILSAWGTTLQRMSLGAFIVAMGMLVDNAVVIIDGIMNDRKRRLSHHIYLYRTVHNTAWPLLAATLIAILAFIGVYLSKGTIAEYASDLFKVLCASLLVSWLLAMVQVPVCTAAWGDSRWWRGRKKKESPLMDKFSSFVRRTVTLLAAHKIVTIAVAVVLVGGAALGFFTIRNNFFPDFEYNQIVVECFWPESANADDVRDNLLKMTGELRCDSNVTRVTASQSSAPAHYCLVRPMTAGGSRYGELMVDFSSPKELEKALPEMRRRLRADYPDAYIRFRKYNMSVATSHPIEVRFSGPDPAVLRQLAAQAEEIMEKSPYIDAYSVQNDWCERSRKISVAFNRENALAANISRSDIANALAAATDGMPIGLVQTLDERRIVRLMVRNSDGSRIEDLSSAPVWTALNIRSGDISLAKLMSSGMKEAGDDLFRTVPVGAVADSIGLVWEENNIHRVNGRRTIEVECDPNPDVREATSWRAWNDIRDAVDAIPLPPGYDREWIGTQKSAIEGIVAVLLKSIIGVFLMIVILLLLFNSWKKLAIILLCLPFMVCGIVPALLLSGKAFTFMVAISLIGMLGMMIKNAIVLVDETDRLIASGVPRFEAVVQATISRTRPVLMASLTTIVGMIPLIPDAMYGSLAVAIMGGLAVGTLVTLIFLPFLYITFFGIKKETLS
jgi:multidrug efflux pump subunit AcrB